MPDLHLIQHEWTTHGTCTGLPADQYFGLIRQVYNSIKIPTDFVSTPRQLNLSVAAVKQEFEQVNPGITDNGMAVTCGGGPYLVAVEICISKDGKPTQCGAGIRDCNKPVLHVPPVR